MRDTYLRDAIALLVLLVALWLARAADAHPSDAPAADEPPVRALVDAAITRAGLAGNPGRSLRRRARWAGLVPRISVRAARDLGWKDSPSLAATSPAAIEVDHGQVLDIRATWRLDRLVFDASETRAIGLESARARARAELAREVIHLYYRRARLAADPAADPVELDEVTALLGELTGRSLPRP